MIQSFLDKGVTVYVLNMGLMDNTSTGKLIRAKKELLAEYAIEEL